MIVFFKVNLRLLKFDLQLDRTIRTRYYCMGAESSPKDTNWPLQSHMFIYLKQWQSVCCPHPEHDKDCALLPSSIPGPRTHFGARSWHDTPRIQASSSHAGLVPDFSQILSHPLTSMQSGTVRCVHTGKWCRAHAPFPPAPAAETAIFQACTGRLRGVCVWKRSTCLGPLE